MNQRFDETGFSLALKTKRIIEKDMGLRDAAKIIGVSSSTLSRMENCKKSDLDSVIIVCNWLRLPLSQFITTKPLTKKRHK
jgi:DNA-binding Xre family transcriptional regulator